MNQDTSEARGLQAQQLATAESEFQCWGVEFRGQGSEPAPPGSLLDLYYDDLLNVVHTVSLQGVVLTAESFAYIYTLVRQI